MWGQGLQVGHDQTAKKDRDSFPRTSMNIRHLPGPGVAAPLTDNTSLTPLTTTPKTHPDFQLFTTTSRHPWTFRAQSWAFSLLCKNSRLRKTSFQHQVLPSTSSDLLDPDQSLH